MSPNLQDSARLIVAEAFTPPGPNSRGRPSLVLRRNPSTATGATGNKGPKPIIIHDQARDPISTFTSLQRDEEGRLDPRYMVISPDKSSRNRAKKNARTLKNEEKKEEERKRK
ncbi:hypothetical protein FALCPG4_009728 [Fusarium falciforme]